MLIQLIIHFLNKENVCEHDKYSNTTNDKGTENQTCLSSDIDFDFSYLIIVIIVVERKKRIDTDSWKMSEMQERSDMGRYNQRYKRENYRRRMN